MSHHREEFRVEGMAEPADAIAPFCNLYRELRDLPTVQGSFRRGHSEHLEHLLQAAKDPEVTLKAWRWDWPKAAAPCPASRWAGRA